MTGFHSKVIYFFTNCFFVILSLSRVGRYICLVKGKNGIQPFPASGNLRLDFRYRSNANDGNELPRYYIPRAFRQNKRTPLQMSFCFGGG